MTDHAPHDAPDRRTGLQRWLPHPLLTLLLILLWMALQSEATAAAWTGAVFLGIVIPIYTANFWPDRPKIRSPLKAIAFVVVVIWDIIIANVHVAYLVLFRRSDRLRSRWVSVPIELDSPEAIAALMGTITLAPGTVSSDLSADGRAILVHCLDLDSEERLIRTIKTRYERRLKAIFP